MKLAQRSPVVTAIFEQGATNSQHSSSYYLERSRDPVRRKKVIMFLILAVVLVVLWLGGFFVLHVSSFLIHLLLIFAVISLIMNFVGGRRSA
jgi:predicted nucleic acid-binding Zn ribbon protein